MKVRVKKYSQSEKPNLSTASTIVLKDGPRVRRVAKHLVVLDEHTGAYHHDSLNIKTYQLTRNACTLQQERSVTLEGDEVRHLADFISSTCRSTTPKKTGEYVLIPTSKLAEADALAKLRDSDDATRVDAFAILLRQSVEHPDLLRSVLERVAQHGDVFLAQAATALNLLAYQKTVANLEQLIQDEGSKEADFQRLLSKNSWLFGSEYNRLLPNRYLTRDEQQDFILARTADGYIEVVEIKTPLNHEPLFAYDRSHNTYYAKAELSKVLAQVENYLEKLDWRRDAILADDGLDANKVRAKIIIGRDGDEHQRQALRRLNGDRHRVEIITFDGLLRIANSVLSFFESGTAPIEADTVQAAQSSDQYCDSR